MSKVIIIGPAYPLRGGLATFDERLARQFMKEGHETLIYTFSLQYPSFLFPGKTQYSESPPPVDLNIKPLINSVNPINWWSVGNQIRKENPDIVLVRYWLPFMAPSLGTILRIVKKNKKTRLIGLIDNALPHEQRPGDHLLTGYFTKALHGFITMSNHVKNDLRKFTTKPVHLVHHPLYDSFGSKTDKAISRKKLNLDQDAYIFLFFGFIRKYKGLDLLIEALDNLKTNINVKILIAGEYYTGEDEIRRQIQMSVSKDKIIEHTHFIKDEDVGLYFSASDCVIQPYRNATQSGVTPLAYHFEIPLIVTNVGALPDLVPTELGYICEPNALSISETMNKMLTFDTKKFDVAIKTEKKKLSWENLTSIIYKTAKENN
ncbi:MAG: glycosyltransferase [Saprospiraceae bacterium]|nr:glycosyltransferase [Saprospiraceae bacterium]